MRFAAATASRLAGLSESAERLTADARSYFTPKVLADYASSLAPLGEPRGFTVVRRIHRGGFLVRAYEASFAQKKLTIVVLTAPDGRLEQYAVYAR